VSACVYVTHEARS